MGVSLRQPFIKNQNRKISSLLNNLFLLDKLVPDCVQDSKRHVKVVKKSGD